MAKLTNRSIALKPTIVWSTIISLCSKVTIVYVHCNYVRFTVNLVNR